MSGFRIQLAPEQTFVLREGVTITNAGKTRAIIIVKPVNPDDDFGEDE